MGSEDDEDARFEWELNQRHLTLNVSMLKFT